MRWRNDGKGDANALQNRFTAYLMVAVHRQKYAYFNRQRQLQVYEIPADYQSTQFIDEKAGNDQWGRFPVMWQIEDPLLIQALERLTARERYILFERVLGERSYEDISGPLGLRYSGTAAAYRRVVQKLRKELGGGKK